MKKHLLNVIFALYPLLVALQGQCAESKYYYNVPQISCSGCQKKIESSLSHLDGVQKVTVNVKAKTVQVLVDAAKITSSAPIEAELAKVGFPANAITNPHL